MQDAPILVLTATIWAYWIGVGIMVIWVLRKTRKSSGVVPKQRPERLTWLIGVPLVVSWIVLPYLATTQSDPLFVVPDSHAPPDRGPPEREITFDPSYSQLM